MKKLVVILVIALLIPAVSLAADGQTPEARRDAANDYLKRGWQDLEGLEIGVFEFYGKTWKLPNSRVVVSSYPKEGDLKTPKQWAACMFVDMKLVYSRYGFIPVRQGLLRPYKNTIGIYSVAFPQENVGYWVYSKEVPTVYDLSKNPALMEPYFGRISGWIMDESKPTQTFQEPVVTEELLGVLSRTEVIRELSNRVNVLYVEEETMQKKIEELRGPLTLTDYVASLEGKRNYLISEIERLEPYKLSLEEDLALRREVERLRYQIDDLRDEIDRKDRGIDRLEREIDRLKG